MKPREKCLQGWGHLPAEVGDSELMLLPWVSSPTGGGLMRWLGWEGRKDGQRNCTVKVKVLFISPSWAMNSFLQHFFCDVGQPRSQRDWLRRLLEKPICKMMAVCTRAVLGEVYGLGIITLEV